MAPAERSPAWLPWVGAALAVAVLLVVETLARPRIEAAAARELADRLAAVLPGVAWDNDLARDTTTLAAPGLATSRERVAAWRARRGGEPAAVVLAVTAPGGYQGPIGLLVGVDRDGRVLGVRIRRHRETPGLGAEAAADDSAWARQFGGQQPADYAAGDWALRRDGGRFDQVTGATVTSRAIVAAVRDAAALVRDRPADVFGTPAAGQPGGGP